MLTLHTRIASADSVDGELVLPFELREKSRLRARLSSGEEVALFTARGSVLRGGDLLGGDDGQGVRIVRIVAAPEATYRIECGTPRELLRCAFHLGNRHAQVEAGGEGASGFLRIRKDTVLKDMLEGLGARVTEEQAPFEPEAGAYGGGHHHGGSHPLAPVPLRQRIHRPSDPSA
jgi:urease accessory protein